MRILWLKSDLLLPLDKGGRLRTWHLMRHLAARHEITYLSFAEGTREGMEMVAQRVETIPRAEPGKGTLRFYADAAKHVFDPLPYAVAKYRSRPFARKLAALLAEQPHDLVVCDFLFPAVNLPRRLPCPAVIFTHNVEAEIWRRHAETKTGIGRILYGMQHARMLRFEGRTLRRFEGVLAVSDADRQTFARLYPDAVRREVHVVPTGVDTDFFAPSPSPDRARSLVFTGSMDWLPNEDAVTYFCREIFPRIRADEPEATLTIVGRAPTPAVRRLAADAGVTVTGRVDDVRPYMEQAAVYVVPLRIGGGTRLKIFEAMAMGKAVVSTTVGAEGLPVTHGEHLVVADEPHLFSRSVVRLIRDLERRRALEAAARTLVVNRYDWSAVARELEESLAAVVHYPHGGAAAPAGVPTIAARGAL
jgi:sugar transferase (PEP-CTERM/EpsH1 system associated)